MCAARDHRDQRGDQQDQAERRYRERGHHLSRGSAGAHGKH
jgi:hypothetical protein